VLCNQNSVLEEERRMSDHDDPNEWEIINRLEGFTDPETTDLLYAYGQILLKEAFDRAIQLDSKAGIAAGFAGGILALLVSSLPSLKNEIRMLYFTPLILFGGIIFVSIAGILATLALGARSYHWVDERDGWFPRDYLGAPDRLKKFYLIGMYRTVVSYDKVSGQRAKRILLAQVFLEIGVLLVGLTLLEIVGQLLWR
jgi:hypothetical protein